MDAVTLDHLLREIGPLVRGRAVRRVRAAGGTALLLEADRSVLWLDVGRETSGVYAPGRPEAERLRAAAPGAPDARSRQALLLFKKHLEGRRLDAPRRVAGERAVVIDLGPATLWLRLARPAVVTLAVDGVPIAGFGGEPVWPPPPPDDGARVAAPHARDRDRGRVLGRPWPGRAARGVPRAGRADRAAAGARSPLVAGHPRGPRFSPAADRAARDRSRRSAMATWARPSCGRARSMRRARRSRHRPGPRRRARSSTCGCVACASARAAGRCWMRPPRRCGGSHSSSVISRTTSQRLPSEETLRRQAEALLASGLAAAAAGESAIDVADPYEPAVRMHVRLDPRLSVPANADRLFEKARRSARARVQVAARLEQAREALRGARADEAAAPLGAPAWPIFPTRKRPSPPRRRTEARADS